MTLAMAPLAARLKRGALEWARSDGVTWVFIIKVLLAAFLTLWLAMRLELPQPRTALATVFIVMQPQSGQVFAKSFYRLLGTLAGSVVTLTLIALFPQNTELFLPSLALWVGLCSAGAMRQRNFRGYGFVLAGYTAAMIGLPVLAHPEGALFAALWRVLEICLGLLVATSVSAAVLPQSASAAMRNALYQRFGTFATFVLDNLAGTGSEGAFEHSNVRFMAEAVGLEGLRSATAFEDPHMRRRSGRVSRLNNQFMALTTRFNALYQLLARLDGTSQVRRFLTPGLDAFTRCITPFAGQPLTLEDAGRLSVALAQYREHFTEHVRELRAGFLETAPSDQDLLDFHTAFELLYRFNEALQGYALTHASLADHHDPQQQQRHTYKAHTHWLASLASGVRGALVLLGLGSFWIATAWPSGATMTLVAAATIGLSAATPNPRRMSFQMACGTLLGACVGFVEYVYVYPQIDGFPLLCVVLAPVFALGAFLASRPAWAGYGLGLLIFFSIGSVPDNLTLYNPYGFINDYIAMVLGMLVCAAAGAVILPPNAGWMWRRQQAELRQLMVFAVSAPSKRLGSFESRARDIVHHAYGLAAAQPSVQRELLRWMLLVLEIGHAVIEIRQEQEGLFVHPAYAQHQPWRQAIRAMGRALIRLFIQPDFTNRERALAAVDHAISNVREADEPFARHFDTSVLRRMQSYLHFIRSSLLDPRSPLAELPAPSGVIHAP